jgi:hypothetical protein
VGPRPGRQHRVTFPFGTPITLITRSGETTDSYGDEDVTATEVTVIGAFDPGGGYSEQDDTTDTRPSVLLPPGSVVTWIDAVRVAGITYEVDGPPMPWNNPLTGRQFGVQVRLKAQLRRPA